MIEIREVQGRRELMKFIKYADRLYKGNPYRVTPLHYTEMEALDPKKNPAFEYCESKYWMAFEEGKPVGRIAAIINHRSNELRKESAVRFGWLDFIDDHTVSAALIHTVEEWAAARGYSKVVGPLGFTDMDFEGLLIEGYNEIGTQAVIYNYPYYPEHLTRLGYAKEVDWVQFEIKVPEKVPEKISRLSEVVKQKYNLRVLQAKTSKDLLPYAPKMFETMNESFLSLYEFVPLTKKQMDYYTKLYFTMINPKYVCFILDDQDEVVGFGISIFSMSKALIKAKGKLFPLGFYHILRSLKKNDTIDLFLQGVKLSYINKGLPAIFFAETMQACIDAKIKYAISSHALETNSAAFLMFNDYEHRQHLRRRCFGKMLNGSSDLHEPLQ